MVLLWVATHWSDYGRCHFKDAAKNDIRLLLSLTVAEITRNKLYILHFYLESSYAIGAIETISVKLKKRAKNLSEESL